MGTLVGVGVGPGDPELVTARAVRVLREADRVVAPSTAIDAVGRAESIVRQVAPEVRVERLVFSMQPPADGRATCFREAAAHLLPPLVAGERVAFATLGDPNLYSTFSYLAQTVRELLDGVAVETVPGITAMQDLAARSGTVLAEGDESVALFPLTAGEEGLRRALAVFDTVVCYKGGRRLPAVLDAARDAGQLDGAVYGAHLGLDGQTVRPAAEMDGRQGPYLSTVILPARRGQGSPGGGR
jgi:precorrin-2/cobalt-factor-2 C20-methyltransferase